MGAGMASRWRAGLAALTLGLTGCGGLGGAYPPGASVDPAASIWITENNSFAQDNASSFVMAGGDPYGAPEPFAPNWEIREARLGAELYHLSLRMKRLHTGGDGEARTAFHRRAAQLARAGGFAGYVVLTYSEGIESQLLPQRVGEGLIQLTRSPR